MDKIMKTVPITINITKDPSTGEYNWKYSGENVDPSNGNFQLPGPGKTAIIYTLDEKTRESYQLIYVNLDPRTCATYEIERVETDRAKSSLTIIDRNSYNNTKLTPFCLRLVARTKDDIKTGFLSPDPQVTNNPNISHPGTGP